ncbi:MAG TPA: hypothetical protein VMF89_32590, partial [Polyangiales bacterium]|nr:hypothetical protein [Polyangiales bacterium]
DNVQAEADLERARQIAARAGNRLEEFYALEFCVYLELARARYQVALGLCADLVSTAERLREGSELAFARTIEALVRVLAGVEASFDPFEKHYAALAAQDAKQRCAFLAAEAAHYKLSHAALTEALSEAENALKLARAVERPTECALALSVIVRAEVAAHSASLPDSCAALSACLEQPVSAFARSRGQQALALAASVVSDSVQEKPHGARDRRTRVRGTSAT